MEFIVFNVFFSLLLHNAYSQCDPKRCLATVKNIFLRPPAAYSLTPPEVDQLCLQFVKLTECWNLECGNAIVTDRAIRDMIQASEITIKQICDPMGRYRLLPAMDSCKIFFPSPAAPVFPSALECLTIRQRSPRMYDPSSNQDDGDNDLTEWKWPSQGGTGPVRPNGYTGGIPNYFTNYISDMGDAWGWRWSWQTPISLPVALTSGSSTFGELAVSPSYPLLFPYASGQTALPPPGLCWEMNDLMECSLRRSCSSPDLTQILKSLALLYIGCSSTVPSSAICDVSRIRYCMRLSGGNIFDVFEPTRYQLYCQNHEAILDCINRDCPNSGGPDLNQQVLTSYKKFIRNFCTNPAYQQSVTRASTNCPILRARDVVLPTSDVIKNCAFDMVQRQRQIRTLCNVVEATIYCLGRERRCDYVSISPQKSALLEMTGCSPAGTLTYDLAPASTGESYRKHLKNMSIVVFAVNLIAFFFY